MKGIIFINCSTVQNNVWLPSMSCLHPIRTSFYVTCLSLDENDSNFKPISTVKRMSHLVSKQSHLDVLTCDFNMSDVLDIVSSQLEKRKTTVKKTDQVKLNDISRIIGAVFSKLDTTNVHHKGNKMTPLVLLP